MIDAVITYVDNTDPVWQKEFQITSAKYRGEYIMQSENSCRWRNFGTLPLQVKCIRKFMPWINKIYIVVSGETQIDSSIANVCWILHKDIIPKDLLPTFNSTCIELFMYRIKELSEQFIYFNDDMYPVAPMEEEDFFENGMPTLVVKYQHSKNYNLYACHLKNGRKLVQSILEQPYKALDIRFGHSAAPMLKSSWEYLWEKSADRLLSSCSPFRSVININQEVVTFYQFLSKKWKVSNRRLYYTTMNSMESVPHILNDSKCQILCINDVGKFNGEAAAVKRLQDILHELAD